jgi:hypothetical protein
MMLSVIALGDTRCNLPHCVYKISVSPNLISPQDSIDQLLGERDIGTGLLEVGLDLVPLPRQSHENNGLSYSAWGALPRMNFPARSCCTGCGGAPLLSTTPAVQWLQSSIVPILLLGAAWPTHCIPMIYAHFKKVLCFTAMCH